MYSDTLLNCGSYFRDGEQNDRFDKSNVSESRFEPADYIPKLVTLAVKRQPHKPILVRF